MKIYTKTGDDGTTGLVGGSRVKKFDPRLEAYGTVDELNSYIGLLRSFELGDEVSGLLASIQNKLFNIGSRLASDENGEAFTADLMITEKQIAVLENVMDAFEEKLPKLTAFILPGGHTTVAYCHVARTVCRRAERRILEFSEITLVQPEVIKYINRLSDFLFVLARKIAFEKNVSEIVWNKNDL